MSFSRYNPEDSVISAESVVRGAWSNGSNSLPSISTGSYTEYYLDAYYGDTVQFSVQYGNLNGSGSKLINDNVPGLTPSRVVYGQYRNLVYGTETTNFSFDNGITTANDIFVINIARSCYKESIYPGSLVLRLAAAGGTPNITLVDDSSTTSLTRYIGENRVFYLISGSSTGVPLASATSSYYGMMFPDLNIIVLNATASSTVSLTSYFAALTTATASVQNNHAKIYNSIVAGGTFTLKSEETISSRYFFTRIKNSEFNYTTNPSIIDTNGNLLYSTLINNPQTYITSVGMYNDNNELLAIAKLSKPLTKDFTKEALIRIKLDY